ncbi:MAG: ROK family protein [Erysipelotrichaceae bacterium]|nr:ROK family protein [Erysipelotrichaceae bacterium]
MTILKLKPACKDYLWGGHRLVDEFDIDYDGDILAEAWELSCHPDGPSVIVNGDYAGRTLKEFIDEKGMEVLGTHCRRFREFPILTKFIDARDNLSIQVHPSNKYALQNENQYGKTEMWYVLDAEPGAYLYYGFKQEITKEEFAERIRDNTLLEVLNAVEVQKGDVLFIESGTLHAIGKGLLIAEIQQNSNVTYRIYDYGRIGKDGKKRDLHIEKALAVTSRVPIMKKGESYPHIADCDYFTVDKLNLDGRLLSRMQGTVLSDSFLSILILEGTGTISSHGEKISYKKGDSILITAGSGDWQIEGVCDALLTTIREKASPVRVGVNIGSAETQIGLVDDQNRIFALRKYQTVISEGADRIIDRAADEILKLLAENEVPLDQCVGVGVAVPGTIAKRQGKVLYSNNIRWEDVPLKAQLGRVIPCPVRIANNADCAALGETIAGAGRDYSDLVLFTLGNGVGGGIVINGEIFEGGVIGGSEVGHMVIRAGGRQCTCGRRGCLESYVSQAALLESASAALGREVSVAEVFDMRDDERIRPVLDEYTESLGCGIVNIVNMFRPQAILLGGLMTEYAAFLIDDLKKIMQEQCFGGRHGMIPDIACAKLGKEAAIIGAASL